jgi:hypothetical protein
MPDLWLHLQQVGYKHKRIRITGSKMATVWYVPYVGESAKIEPHEEEVEI